MNTSIATDTDLSETQLKKMFRAFLSGNEGSLKWNEIIKHFSEMPDARQRAAFRKVPLNAFEVIRANLNDVYESDKKQEAEALKEKLDKIKNIRSLITEQGLTIEDITSIVPLPTDKNKPQNISQALSEKESQILEYLLTKADTNNIFSGRFEPIAEHFKQNKAWVNNGINKLRHKGFIENVDNRRGVYRIVEV